MSETEMPAKRRGKLQFHYIKSSEYRESPCHGVLGGVTPQGQIWMALYSERGPIPRLVEFDVEAPDGNSAVEFNETTETPSLIEGRRGIIRHIETSTYLDIETAKRIHKWLGDRINEANSGHGSASVKQ